MRTIETKVYQFDELSDRAKERAADWYRETSSDDFIDFEAESVLDDAARLGLMFGVNIRTKSVRPMNGSTRQKPNVYYSMFSSQGDGLSYAGYYHYVKGSVAAVEAEAPSTYDGKLQQANANLNTIVRGLQAIQRKHFYRIQATTYHGRHLVTHIDVERNDGVEMSDVDIDTVKDLLLDFANWIHHQLEAQYDYVQSDEAVADTIRANEYEFDEEGNRK